ncbi:MAG: hypothetical protein R6V06_09525 [Kiritimatiellia bacterium]
MKRIYLIIIFLTALTLVNGCFDPFHMNPYFAVEESGLNWLEIYSKQISSQKLTRVRIDGSGIVKITTGTSPLVGDAFAKDISDTQWSNVRRDRITIPREETVRLFQGLINNGLFLEQSKTEDSPDDHIIMAFGNIQNHTVYETIYDPGLHEHLKTIVMLFNRPRQKRR